MDAFLNALKAQAGALDQATGQARFGLVSSVSAEKATARVMLQPENVLTGWLPVLSPWAGAGWGMVCLPSPGEQVLVLAQEGDAEHGVIVGRAFSQAAAPPLAEVGELLLAHKSGAFVKLANDGTVRVQGDLHVAGDVYDQHGSLARLRGHYNAHRHPPSNNSANPQD